MLIRIGLPIVAVLLLGFAIKNVTDSQKPTPKLPPPIEPVRNPFPNTVAGAGMVEPQTENITMGSPLAGVVVEVTGKVGMKVNPGDPLFRLDDRQLQAELRVRQAMLEDARVRSRSCKRCRGTEELPPAEARVRETKADYENMQEQMARGEKLFEKRAMAEEEYTNRRQMMAQARERYNKAVADFDLLKAGAWENDKAVAKAAVARVEAQIKQTETDLDRLMVRALVEADVLQVNVRPGEFVGAPPASAGPGRARQRQAIARPGRHRRIRHPPLPHGLSRRAMLKGQPQTSFPLKFVRVEPYVVPKKSLTGDNTERVDTRVLQVIYAIDAGTAAALRRPAGGRVRRRRKCRGPGEANGRALEMRTRDRSCATA